MNAVKLSVLGVVLSASSLFASKADDGPVKVISRRWMKMDIVYLHVSGYMIGGSLVVYDKQG